MYTLQCVPAIAVSLDNYKALTPEGFMAGAAYVVALVKVSNCLAVYIKTSRKSLCSASSLNTLLFHCMTALLRETYMTVTS